LANRIFGSKRGFLKKRTDEIKFCLFKTSTKKEAVSKIEVPKKLGLFKTSQQQPTAPKSPFPERRTV
tara:strand:+ start:444 stop:644 length:201 start_codon:yes stop_codon:yes gene_type:complete